MKDGFQVGVRAYPVILTIGSDERTVKSHIAALSGRNQFQFCGGKIFFFNAISILEEFHQRILSSQVFFAVSCADGLKLFSGNTLSQCLLHLVLCHVDKQVRNIEYRVIILHPYIDFHLFPTAGIYYPDECHRNAGPLILLDSTIIMGPEINHSIAFMNRISLQIQTRGIQMGTYNLKPVMNRLFADYSQYHRFPLLIPEHLIPRLQFLHVIERLKSCFFRLSENFCHSQSFCAGGIQKLLISFPIFHSGLAFFFIHSSPNGFCSAIGFFHICLLFK